MYAEWTFLLCLFSVAHANLLVYSPTEIAGSYVAVGYLFVGQKGSYQINATVVGASPFDACKPLTESYAYQDAIVVATEGNIFKSTI